MIDSSENRILAGAFQLFLEYSYEKVSTSLLEEKIGLTRGAIFYYAKNKNQLFRDVINKYVLEKQDVKNKMSSVNIERVTLFEFLNTYIDCAQKNINSMRSLVNDESKAYGAYFRLLYQAQLNYEGFSELITQKFEEERSLLDQVVKYAIKRGEIKQELNPAEVARHIRYIFIGNSFEESLKIGFKIEEARSLILSYYNLIK